MRAATTTALSLLPDDVDRDLHRRNRAPVLKPVCRVPVLGPAHSRTILRGGPVSMVRDRSLQDVDDARSALVVVDRAKDAARRLTLSFCQSMLNV